MESVAPSERSRSSAVGRSRSRRRGSSPLSRRAAELAEDDAAADAVSSRQQSQHQHQRGGGGSSGGGARPPPPPRHRSRSRGRLNLGGGNNNGTDAPSVARSSRRRGRAGKCKSTSSRHNGDSSSSRHNDNASNRSSRSSRHGGATSSSSLPSSRPKATPPPPRPPVPPPPPPKPPPRKPAVGTVTEETAKDSHSNDNASGSGRHADGHHSSVCSRETESTCPSTEESQKKKKQQRQQQQQQQQQQREQQQQTDSSSSGRRRRRRERRSSSMRVAAAAERGSEEKPRSREEEESGSNTFGRRRSQSHNNLEFGDLHIDNIEGGESDILQGKRPTDEEEAVNLWGEHEHKHEHKNPKETTPKEYDQNSNSVADSIRDILLSAEGGPPASRGKHERRRSGCSSSRSKHRGSRTSIDECVHELKRSNISFEDLLGTTSANGRSSSRGRLELLGENDDDDDFQLSYDHGPRASGDQQEQRRSASRSRRGRSSSRCRSAGRGNFLESEDFELSYNDGLSSSRKNIATDNNRPRSQSRSRYEAPRSHSRSKYDAELSASRSKYDAGRSASRSKYDAGRSASRSKYDVGRSASRSQYDAGRSASRSQYDAGLSASRSKYEVARSASMGRPQNRSRSRSRFDAGQSASSGRFRSGSRARSQKQGRSQSRSRNNNGRSQSRSRNNHNHHHHQSSDHHIHPDDFTASSLGRRYQQIDGSRDNNRHGDATTAALGSQERPAALSRSLNDTTSSPPRSTSPGVISSRSSRSRRSVSRSVRAANANANANANNATTPSPREPPSSEHRSRHNGPDPPEDDDVPAERSINLVIDAEGHGTFHIATKGLVDNEKSSGNPLFPSSAFSKSKKKAQSHLTFDIQIDESSQRYLIHTSMGRLDGIRSMHPGMNILRTLSYWNGLQKRRYGANAAEVVRGGRLGIVSKNGKDLVAMTLMGEYSHRAWEHDEVFQLELERFVEDALQFHLCLSGDASKGGGGEKGGGGDKAGGAAGGAGSSDNDTERGKGGVKPRSGGRRSVHDHIFTGNGGGGNPSDAASPTNQGPSTPAIGSGTPGSGTKEDPSPSSGARRRTSKLFGKVLQKVHI